ncbi:MAG: hypothetical protein KJO76_06385, partial [Gammaproteobacteria bacterium]|nr:hypothetical protein [Gammaproteobacteria bacterium]
MSAVVVAGCGGSSNGEVTTDTVSPSVAREWNEVLLQAIRGDFARPTVHARNLWHISAAMYDAWAVFDDTAATWLLDSEQNGYSCDLDPMPAPANVQAAREEAISHAAYQLITYRFRLSPGVLNTEDNADELLEELGFDPDNDSVDYTGGDYAALGNYIAECYIAYGHGDGSNELGFYANQYYMESQAPIEPNLPGNPNITDLNRWQRIQLPSFIDQSGNPIGSDVPFLSPEWGQVDPFALDGAPKDTFQRDGFDYQVYYPDLVPQPPTFDGPLAEEYKWGFALVSVWSGHLDPADGVMVDISPATLGSPDNANIETYYPASFENYDEFYDLLMGGDPSTGYPENPVTGEPYEPQMVPRGDYARVLAEFWADGPDSETPPGHWYVIMNEEVIDSPFFERRFEGQGEELGPLEWDVKAYFALGGTMHDAAIAAWGIKGWFDYLRPVSAIRAMADRGQSSDPMLPNYSPDGLPLIDGYIELVTIDDPVNLRGGSNEHVDKIKVYAWRGPTFINDPETDTAGVGWIRAERWWPYQRPSFVTPPFAGYVSGHSTYSRAAAEALTLLTGDPFFPGGLGEFEAPKNEFLVFE